MRLRHTIDEKTVRELGRMLDDLTYGICTVEARKLQARKRRCRETRCARPVSPGIAAEADRYLVTVTDLLAPSGEQEVVFRGHNACRDATAYLLGRLQAKTHLTAAMRTRIQMWHEELRRALRRDGRHQADYYYQHVRGMADMRV